LSYSRDFSLTHKITEFWTFPIFRYSREFKTRRFRNWICFRPLVRGEKTPTQLGPLERANLNHWTAPARLNSCVNLTGVVQRLRLTFSKGPPFTLRRKNIQFLKRCVLNSLEHRTTEKVQNTSYYVCYTPSSEPIKSISV
jgi:hypothetical protein